MFILSSETSSLLLGPVVAVCNRGRSLPQGSWDKKERGSQSDDLTSSGAGKASDRPEVSREGRGTGESGELRPARRTILGEIDRAR